MLARVEMVAVDRVYTYSTLDDAAALCLPGRSGTPAEWDLARTLVDKVMDLHGITGRVTYRYQGQVAILVWEVGGLG